MKSKFRIGDRVIHNLIDDYGGRIVSIFLKHDQYCYNVIWDDDESKTFYNYQDYEISSDNYNDFIDKIIDRI